MPCFHGNVCSEWVSPQLEKSHGLHPHSRRRVAQTWGSPVTRLPKGGALLYPQPLIRFSNLSQASWTTDDVSGLRSESP
eukprot:25100-Eustigmatos_ZCMA.PRE.1